MKKIISVLKIFILSVTSVLALLIVGLYVYTIDSYQPQDAMYEVISNKDYDNISVTSYYDYFDFKVKVPKGNIIFIPGGKVTPESYLYLSYELANLGYNVKLAKPLFNLAILTPTYYSKFIDYSHDNIIIGHSLGGTVGSIIASNEIVVSKMIFLGSYAQNEINQKTLLITGSNDLIMNKDNFDKNLNLLKGNYIHKIIEGGNHSGFGYYGHQTGDGKNLIGTINQQNEVISLISDFLI